MYWVCGARNCAAVCLAPTPAQDALSTFNELLDDVVIDAPMGAVIKTLWADPGIQEAYSQRIRFQLIDSAP